MIPEVSPGFPGPLGVTAVTAEPPRDEHPADARTSVNVAVWAPAATAVDFCIFECAEGPDGPDITGPYAETRVRLPYRAGGIHYARITGPGPGTRYGLRVHGEWNPDKGLYLNPDKLIIDPYARIIEAPVHWHPLMSGFYDDGNGPDRRDSAPVVPKCVVADPPGGADSPGAAGTGAAGTGAASPPRPRHDDTELVIYETHLKGISASHPGVPADIRGTYAGMGHPVIIDHLVALGVTAVELLPLQTFIDDRFLVNREQTNYWGYQPVGWFAAEPRYATDGTGATADRELRELVDTLHAAGIEVIVDVVYNHSGESDELGPTLALRGLDNNGYYLMADGEFVDVTGTGNSLATGHPQALRLVTDSLRHWVTHFGVDGFRFDLGATVGRVVTATSGPAGEFSPTAPFFQTLAQDPVLSRVRLIAEPWDLGPDGYRLGDFPWPWAEWNDRFRDGVRRLWRGESPATTDFGSLMLGSASRFDGADAGDGTDLAADRPDSLATDRPPTASVNFLTAHDGFTLADVVSYVDRHNEANGENNADGHGENFSDNLGVEGPTDDPVVVEARARRVRGMLATLLLAQGTPMLLAGDEMGNSQGGNNNAYVQDNPTGWVDWAGTDTGGKDADLLAFTRELIALRRRLPVLRQSAFRHGQVRADGRRDVEWFRADGEPMTDDDWHASDGRPVGVVLRGPAGDVDGEALSGAVAVVVTTGGDAEVTLPSPGGGDDGGGDGDSGDVWTLELDTARPCPFPGTQLRADRMVSNADTTLSTRTWDGTGAYPVGWQSVVVFSSC